MDRIITCEGDQTAAIISQHTGVPVTERTKELHPWDLDGQERDYILKRPNQGAPESFTGFKRRYLGKLKQLMDQHRTNPLDRTVTVSPEVGVRLVEAWAKKGFPADLAIDLGHMASKAITSRVHRLHCTASGKWKLTPQDLKASGELQPGIYLTVGDR